MKDNIRLTRSICPVCLKNLPADLILEKDGQIYLEKNCPDHGFFRVLVWNGKIDFESWCSGSSPLQRKHGQFCPQNCGICSEHESGTCCILLEVTNRCNLHCSFCFANGGSITQDPSLSELERAVTDIASRFPGVLLQLSGGEPTLRDDLPELIRFAKTSGCGYVQLNTNGIRLAEDPDFASRLAEAGLDIVFLQFDGTKDCIFESLRGSALLQKKKKAIQICADLKLGVVLVPTVVKGINTDDLGNLIRLACSFVPAVRGIHFQPISYFGRYPKMPDADDRYTLDQLIADLCDQTDIPTSSFLPSRCDHPLCGFHSRFLTDPSGALQPLPAADSCCKTKSSAEQNRSYVVRHWKSVSDKVSDRNTSCCPDSLHNTVFSSEINLDTLLEGLQSRSLTLSAMAFQDAMNLNIERLVRCSLHVYKQGTVRPFCAVYLSPLSAHPDTSRQISEHPCAIITAAGLSSRMGRFKALLPLESGTVISRTIDSITEAGISEILVVTGHQHAELESYLKTQYQDSSFSVRTIYNPSYASSEMFDSLCMGLSALSPDCDRVVITPCDVPLVRPETIRLLLQTRGSFVRPVYKKDVPSCICNQTSPDKTETAKKGMSGHPCVIDSSIIETILHSSGEGGLRGVLESQNIPVTNVPTNDAGILMNLNRPEDYHRLYEQTAKNANES